MSVHYRITEYVTGSTSLPTFHSRRRLERYIDELIMLLDEMDGDTDLEEFLEGDDREDLEPDYDDNCEWPSEEGYIGPMDCWSPIRFATTD